MIFAKGVPEGKTIFPPTGGCRDNFSAGVQDPAARGSRPSGAAASRIGFDRNVLHYSGTGSQAHPVAQSFSTSSSGSAFFNFPTASALTAVLTRTRFFNPL